jgi:hypothetical protein
MLSHASAHPGAMQGSTRSRSPFPRVVKEPLDDRRLKETSRASPVVTHGIR